MNDDHLQVRDRSGQQVRSQLRDADLVRIIQESRLPPAQRQLLVEYVSAAIVAAEREPLGGLKYLERMASELPDLPGLRATAHRLSTAFVHPPLR